LLRDKAAATLPSFRSWLAMPQIMFPLFPLEMVLLPEEPLPLYIFEERYKQMIGECLEAKSAGSAAQQFGVVLAKDQEMRTVGCSARIINLTRKYPDGRMDILTVGTRRFEVLLTDEEKPYLRAEVDFFDDDPGADTADDQEAQAAIDLFRAAMQRLRKSPDMPIHLPPPYRYLSFRIAAPLPLDLDFKQRLLSIRNETERLHEVTDLIKLLITRFDFLRKVQSKAGGNGNVRPEPQKP
jgi:Lon protease-like protein